MNFLEIIITIALIAVGFVSTYLKTKTNILDKVTYFITEAENEYKDITKSGGVKFARCVNSLYSLVPSFFKPFITKEAIGGIVQKTFDSIKEFVEIQLDKVVK